MTELPKMIRNRSTAALSRRTVLIGGIALPIVAASGLTGSAVAQPFWPISPKARASLDRS